MWWRNWWEAVRDPFDPVPRRLWKALVLFLVGLLMIFVVWPRVRIEWLALDLQANPGSPTARAAAWRLGELGRPARSALRPLIEVLDFGPIEQPAPSETQRSTTVHQIGPLSVEAALAIRKIGAPDTVDELLRRMLDCRRSESGEGTGAARLYIALQNAADLQPEPAANPSTAVANVVEVLRDSRNPDTCQVLLNWLHARSLVGPEMDSQGRIQAVLTDCLTRLHATSAARLLIAWAEQDAAVVPIILDEERRRFREHPRNFTSTGVLYQPIRGRENRTIRDSLPWLMQELSGPDAPLIVRLLAECYWFDRQQDDRYRREPRRAELLLKSFGEALADERSPVRRGTLQILTRIAGTNPADEPPFDSEMIDRVTQLLADEAPAVRLAAAEALWTISHQAEPGLGELLAGLESDDADARNIAGQFFEGIGPRDAWATAALTDRLESSSPVARIALMKSLAAMGSAARSAVPAVTAMLTVDDQPTLKAAIDSLAAFGPAAHEALPRLWDVFLASEDVEVRRLANTAMSKIDPKRRLPQP